MKIITRLDQWKEQGVISAEQHAFLTGLSSGEIFSLSLELNTLLYAGILTFVAGLGWTVSTWSQPLGDVLILTAVFTIVAASFWHCFSRAPAWSATEAPSSAGVKALVLMIPDDTIPSEAVISLNGRVLLFSICVAALTTFLAGLVPALHALRRQLAEPLKDSGKGVSGGFRRGGLRKLLVVSEIALSLILLAGAGLLMRTMVALQTVDLGLNPDNILVIRLPSKGPLQDGCPGAAFLSTVVAAPENSPGCHRRH